MKSCIQSHENYQLMKKTSIIMSCTRHESIFIMKVTHEKKRFFIAFIKIKHKKSFYIGFIKIKHKKRFFIGFIKIKHKKGFSPNSLKLNKN